MTGVVRSKRGVLAIHAEDEAEMLTTQETANESALVNLEKS